MMVHFCICMRSDKPASPKEDGQGITAIKASFSSKTVCFKKPTCVS